MRKRRPDAGRTKHAEKLMVGVGIASFPPLNNETSVPEVRLLAVVADWRKSLVIPVEQ